MTLIEITLSDAEVDRIAARVAERLAAQNAQVAPAGARPDYLTLTEMAELARRSTRSVRRLLAAGRLRGTRSVLHGSSRVLIARAEAERFLREGAL